MNKPKYQIGDVVWVGEWKAYEVSEPCPDCGGTRALKVILFDGTEYIIECEGCKRGYEGPYGIVRRTAYRPVVVELQVQGVGQGCWSDEIGKWKYQVGYEAGGTCYQEIIEDEVFIDEQSALNFAISKGRQLEINEAARVLMKDKPAKTWAWHVTYHRREIKRAEKNLVYHTAKLNAAKGHVKAEK